jgi:hypothetical protein
MPPVVVESRLRVDASGLVCAMVVDVPSRRAQTHRVYGGKQGWGRGRSWFSSPPAADKFP